MNIFIKHFERSNWAQELKIKLINFYTLHLLCYIMFVPTHATPGSIFARPIFYYIDGFLNLSFLNLSKRIHPSIRLTFLGSTFDNLLQFARYFAETLTCFVPKTNALKMLRIGALIPSLPIQRLVLRSHEGTARHLMMACGRQ